jgi:predicted nucleic acid-binding protein
MPFLIDSNVLIGVSRGNAAAIKYVGGLAGSWALSQVTTMELIFGARDKRDLAMIGGFLSLYPLNRAIALGDLAAIPGNQLEAPKHDCPRQHSIRINDQYRVCFRWNDGDAFDVEITDYH